MKAIDTKIYLAGPINGCSDEECKTWRELVKKKFPMSLDPMDRDYRGNEKHSYKQIIELDKHDIAECDYFLANISKPSIGTSMEIFYAHILDKFIVCVIPFGEPISPWVMYHSTSVVTTIEEAIETIEYDINRRK